MKSGIVLYNIELDGCLNGVYTNDACDGEIFNEIAMMRTKKPDSDDLCGVYLCTYFENSKFFSSQKRCRSFLQ